jgi:hypothetical protein
MAFVPDQAAAESAGRKPKVIKRPFENERRRRAEI